MMTETNGKTTERAVKKRRVIMDDSDEDVASAIIPSPPKSTKLPKSSPKAKKTVTSASHPTAKPAPKLAEETPSGEESGSASAEDEPDPQTKKKSAEELFTLVLPSD